MKNQTKAFTLVELSIVIVVIGLLVGGVTAGYSLVKAARLRSVVSDVNKYKAAVQAFRLQYNSWPGDLTTATSYWPSAGTNNGNGDRKIAASTAVQGSEERLLLWQHLSLANLISGAYTGYDTTAGQSDIGINVPKAAKSNHGSNAGGTGFEIYNNSIPAIWGEIPREPNYLAFGAPASNSLLIGAAISPVDAHNLDSKIDDGQPFKGGMGYINGIVTGVGWAGASCYDLSYTTDRCIMYFTF